MLAMGDKINSKKIAKQVYNSMNVIILLFVLITYSRPGLTPFQALKEKYWMPKLQYGWPETWWVTPSCSKVTYYGLHY